MIVHLNGRLVDAADARVSIFDRGFLFGDGVYEGLRVTEGHIIGLDRHQRRMRAGLTEARIAGFDPSELGDRSRELLDANRIGDAFIYWQVTRGAPRAGEPLRERTPTAMAPTVCGFVSPLESIGPGAAPAVRTAQVAPDLRWARGRLKSISLMGSVLAAIEAAAGGAEDAIMHQSGLVTEATASNVIIARDGELATPDLDSTPILAGVTREILLEACPRLTARPVPLEELREADEVMLVGTSSMVTSVTRLDGRPLGEAGASGAPGVEAGRLLGSLIEWIEGERAGTGVHSSHG